jgi:Tfp pilus assembly protein FimT
VTRGRTGGASVRDMTGPWQRDDGTSLLELACALAVVILLAGLAAPVTAQAIDAGRARHAAGFVASRFRMARQLAIVGSRSAGLVFDQAAGRWTFRVCIDGNGNGLRRTDIASGADTCPEGPYDIGTAYPGVAIDTDPALPDPAGGAGSSDPVRFGRSDIASFSPSGTATAGTLYIRSARDRHYAIRVANVTGRTRVLRFETGSRRWLTGL